MPKFIVTDQHYEDSRVYTADTFEAAAAEHIDGYYDPAFDSARTYYVFSVRDVQKITVESEPRITLSPVAGAG